jgi:hypothetical protein
MYMYVCKMTNFIFVYFFYSRKLRPDQQENRAFAIYLRVNSMILRVL